MPQRNDSIKLFDGKAGQVHSVAGARIEDDGALTVWTSDIGEYVEQFWGDTDYEYWVTVSPQHKDLLILALLEKCYTGDAEVVADFKELLETKRIAFEFDTWI
jgi:hypothetical protein